MNLEAKIVAGVIVVFLILVILKRASRLQSQKFKSEPVKAAKVPDSNVRYNLISDLKVGAKGRIVGDFVLFVDREHHCWIDTGWTVRNDPYEISDDLGAAEVTRTKTGYAVKLLTPNYKLHVRNNIHTQGVCPVEKFEIVKEDT